MNLWIGIRIDDVCFLYLSSGHIAERVNLRYFLTFGMLASGLFTALFGFGFYWKIHSLAYYISMQVCNIPDYMKVFIESNFVQGNHWPSSTHCDLCSFRSYELCCTNSIKLVLPSCFISWKTHFLILAGSAFHQIWLGREPFQDFTITSFLDCLRSTFEYETYGATFLRGVCSVDLINFFQLKVAAGFVSSTGWPGVVTVMGNWFGKGK